MGNVAVVAMVAIVAIVFHRQIRMKFRSGEIDFREPGSTCERPERREVAPFEGEYEKDGRSDRNGHGEAG